MKYVMIEIAYYIAGKAKQILGGTLSVNQYKDYVLALLFLKDKKCRNGKIHTQKV